MKPIGAIVTLTGNPWDGPAPKAGAFLQTPTGRTYEVLSVRTTPSGRHVMRCIVRAPDHPIPAEADLFYFQFHSRRPKKRGRAPIL